MIVSFNKWMSYHLYACEKEHGIGYSSSIVYIIKKIDLSVLEQFKKKNLTKDEKNRLKFFTTKMNLSDLESSINIKYEMRW